MDRLVSTPCLIPTSYGAFRAGRWLLLYLLLPSALDVPVGGEAAFVLTLARAVVWRSFGNTFQNMRCFEN